MRETEKERKDGGRKGEGKKGGRSKTVLSETRFICAKHINRVIDMALVETQFK